jgi:hypothetical protein
LGVESVGDIENFFKKSIDKIEKIWYYIYELKKGFDKYEKS